MKNNIKCAIPLKECCYSKKEIWKEIEGYSGKYLISNKGKVVRRNKRGEYVQIKISKNDKGYPYFHTIFNGKKVTRSLHRTVAFYFLPNPQNFNEINHKDENKENNDVGNLEWCTRRYNNCYGTRLQKQVATRVGIN